MPRWFDEDYADDEIKETEKMDLSGFAEKYTGAGFNPRPRAGGDETLVAVTGTITSFNPRPRAGGDSS